MGIGPVTILGPDGQLKLELSHAIEAFNAKRVAILEKAFAEGGDDAVAILENKYDDLRGAFLDILQRELDRNHARYVELTAEAKTQTEQLQASIDSLDRTASILNGIAGVIGAVAKISSALAL
jgi:hypothetical protein